MSTLPPVDFNYIAAIAHDAIQMYGSPAEFTEHGAGLSRPVRVVVYRDERAGRLLQDADSVPALALLDGQDFQAPNRLPQQFDQIRVTADGATLNWTLNADPHPVYASYRLPIYIAELRRG